MTTRFRDPLLTTSRVIITFFMGLAAFVAGSVLVAAPAIIFARGRIMAELVTEAGHPIGNQALAGIVAILLLVAAMAALAFLFLREMRRVIDSVSQGDPFAPVNAQRLARMGWLTVAIELVSIPVGGIGQWLAATIKDATSDFGISVGGLLLAMVLFILARVFREGARMRAELEGTV